MINNRIYMNMAWYTKGRDGGAVGKSIRHECDRMVV